MLGLITTFLHFRIFTNNATQKETHIDNNCSFQIIFDRKNIKIKLLEHNSFIRTHVFENVGCL